MTRNAFKLVVAVLILLTGISYAAVDLTSNQPTRIVCDIWPPYQMRDKDGVTGFSTEMVQAVFKRLDVSIAEINDYPWKRALAILEHNKADVLFSANYTKDRSIFARYPDEVLFEAPWMIWTRNNKKIKTLDDLKGKTIGVVIGYSYTREFWTFIETYCKIEKVSTDEINFKKLEIGRLDAIVAEYGNASYLIRKLELKGITPHKNIVIKKDGLYVVFNKSSVDEAFVKNFSSELKKYKQSPEYKALQKKYFGD